ncbi:hypothetical protein [Phenylobacterium sp.]|uniref:hypothetical protein n=1 Tax=Phenylobacterium sp. TaxID=1871053 RepID=UPI002C2F1B70|nr:hypothetical protein [Phenylobacterium sp.]HLZ74914.1 hypothetical protein [Phenylobacterium sp.]
MTRQGHSPVEAWYMRRMAAHRRGLVRHWPFVLVALAVAVVIGVLSPDRSKSSPPPPPAPAAAVR